MLCQLGRTSCHRRDDRVCYEEAALRVIVSNELCTLLLMSTLRPPIYRLLHFDDFPHNWEPMENKSCAKYAMKPQMVFAKLLWILTACTWKGATELLDVENSSLKTGMKSWLR